MATAVSYSKTYSKNIQPDGAKRYTYIDAIRVYAVIMVVALHSIYGYYNDMNNSENIFWWLMGFANEIARTGVPLFFMISGFLLIGSKSAEKPALFYKRRFLKLGIPFIIYDIFYYCYYRVLYNQSIISIDFFKELIGSGSAMHLWFIYSIAVLYLFVPFLKMITDKCSVKMLFLFLVLAVFQTTFKPLVNTMLGEHAELVIADDGIVGYMGYMILGYILGTYELKKPARYIIYSLSMLSLVIFPIINSVVAYKTWNMLFNGGYNINHYIEAAGIFLLLKNIKYTRIHRFLESAAGLCMSIYFIHLFFIERIAALISHFPPMAFYPALYVFSLAASFVTAYVIRKLKSTAKHAGGKRG